MLRAFPDAYKHPNPRGRGPRDSSISNNKAVTLKTGGSPELYNNDYDDEFKWYPYLFLSRSKPETHIAALACIKDSELAQNAPPELRALVEHVKKTLGLEEDNK